MTIWFGLRQPAQEAMGSSRNYASREGLAPPRHAPLEAPPQIAGGPDIIQTLPQQIGQLSPIN